MTSSHYQHQSNQNRHSSSGFYHGLTPRHSGYTSSSHSRPSHRSAAQKPDQEPTDYCIQDGRIGMKKFMDEHGLGVTGEFGTSRKVSEVSRQHSLVHSQAAYGNYTSDSGSQCQPERPGYRQTSLRTPFGPGSVNGLGTPLRPHTPSAPTGRIWPEQHQRQDSHARSHTPPLSHPQISSSRARAVSPPPCPPEFRHLRAAAASGPAKKGYPTPARPPAVFGSMGGVGLRTSSPGPVPRYITPGPEQWQSHRTCTPAPREYGQEHIPTYAAEPENRNPLNASKLLSSTYLTPTTAVTGSSLSTGARSIGYETAFTARSYSESSSDDEYDIDASDDSFSDDDETENHHLGVNDDRKDGQESWTRTLR